MAEYRVALEVLASDGADPTAVLGRLDTAAARLGDGLLSTCLYGIFDVDKETWTYASAGHPPPLLRHDGHTAVLDSPHGPPIGAQLWTGHELPATAVRLGDDDLVALYTDGRVERRHVPIDVGIPTLANRIDQVQDPPEAAATCQAIVHDIVGTSPPDDVAITVIRHRHERTPSGAGEPALAAAAGLIPDREPRDVGITRSGVVGHQAPSVRRARGARRR
jgi:serine phosphatase RsbU (regulator of sigma subunit)